MRPKMASASGTMVVREREEDVSHRDAEFNHSHTIPKQAVSDLLKTVLCLLKVVINVSALVNNDRVCRIWCCKMCRCVGVGISSLGRLLKNSILAFLLGADHIFWGYFEYGSSTGPFIPDERDE